MRNVAMVGGTGETNLLRAQKIAQALQLAGRWNGRDKITIRMPATTYDTMVFDGMDALVPDRHYRIEQPADARLRALLDVGRRYRFQDLPEWASWDTPAKFAGRVVSIDATAVKVQIGAAIASIPTAELADAVDAGEISIIDLATERLTKPATIVVDINGQVIRVKREAREKVYDRRRLNQHSLKRLLAIMRAGDWRREYESDEDFETVTIWLRFAA